MGSSENHLPAARGRSTAELRFEALLESVAIGVVISGPEGIVRTFNRAALDLLCITEDELAGTTSFDPKWSAVYEDGSPCPPEQHPIPRAIASRQPVRNVVLGVRRRSCHDLVWVVVNAEPQLN